MNNQLNHQNTQICFLLLIIRLKMRGKITLKQHVERFTESLLVYAGNMLEIGFEIWQEVSKLFLPQVLVCTHSFKITAISFILWNNRLLSGALEKTSSMTGSLRKMRCRNIANKNKLNGLKTKLKLIFILLKLFTQTISFSFLLHHYCQHNQIIEIRFYRIIYWKEILLHSMVKDLTNFQCFYWCVYHRN